MVPTPSRPSEGRSPRRRSYSPLDPEKGRARRSAPALAANNKVSARRESVQAARPITPGQRAAQGKQHGTSASLASNPPLRRGTARPASGRGRGNGRSRGHAGRPPLRNGNGPMVQRKSAASAPLPDVAPNTVRVVPLGGVEEVGKNMLLVETAEDIVISDIGFQFVSDEETPGIDYVLPNTTYLEERKEKIRGVFITHGHLDHIGGIPFIMERIGNPPLYTSELTALMIKKRQAEFPHLPPLDLHVVEDNVPVTLGGLSVRLFPVTHSILDSRGVIVGTRFGNVVISGDLKLDHVDGVPTAEEEKIFGAIGKEDNILLIADSTNAEKSGFSIPEKHVHVNIEEIIKNAKGRLIIGTFASQFERMIKIIEVCEKYNKKIVTEGRSIRTNIEVAIQAGRLKPKKDTIITAEAIGDYPADKIVVLATGAQGEEFAALMRISTGKHRFITLSERDTIMLSSSVIPGNEISVQRLKDNLYRHGVHIIHYRSSDVHSTGHGNTGELVWINKMVKPRFHMPAYGFHSMIRSHAYAIEEAGFPKENIIIPDNGSLIDFVEGKELVLHKEKAPSSLMLVDGFAVGGMQEVVIRDRKTLSQDGMFVIIATLNLKTGKLRKSPDIISRGFVYLRESQQLLSEARVMVARTVEKTTANMYPINFEAVKNEVTDALSRYLFEKTNKRPIVIPVVLGV